MKKHEATRQFLNSKALTYDGSGSGAGGVPDTPYECRHCGKGYKNFSSLMQHQVYRFKLYLMTDGTGLLLTTVSNFELGQKSQFWA